MGKAASANTRRQSLSVPNASNLFFNDNGGERKGKGLGGRGRGVGRGRGRGNGVSGKWQLVCLQKDSARCQSHFSRAKCEEQFQQGVLEKMTVLGIMNTLFYQQVMLSCKKQER